MSFEIETALQRLLLPTLCSLIGCYLLSKTDLGADWYDDEPVRGIALPTFFGALICAAGLIGSDLWQRGIITKPNMWSEWHASYQWEWMAWTIPGSMVLLGLVRSIFTVPIHFTAMAGIATATIAVGVLFHCLNEGSTWEDQSEKLLPWMAVSCIAAMWNSTSLNSIARSDGSRWVSLTILGQLGCVAAITLQSYASLGLWAVAGIGAATGASIIGLFLGSSTRLHYGWQLSIVVIPLGIMAVACLAVSRFSFEFKPLPVWLIGSVLFLPSIVGLVDFVIGRLWNNWFRAFLAACLCSSVLGAILTITKPWQSEW